MLLTQTLILVTLLGVGLYYRRYRLAMLVQSGQRQARHLLGLAGVLVLALAWSLVGSMINPPGDSGYGADGLRVAYVGLPLLGILGTAMVVTAARAGIDRVIAFLDFLTLYRPPRR